MDILKYFCPFIDTIYLVRIQTACFLALYPRSSVHSLDHSAFSTICNTSTLSWSWRWNTALDMMQCNLGSISKAVPLGWGGVGGETDFLVMIDLWKGDGTEHFEVLKDVRGSELGTQHGEIGRWKRRWVTHPFRDQMSWEVALHPYLKLQDC